jgi:tRNA threonylcarbamoyl adenosine modification protein YeaZ
MTATDGGRWLLVIDTATSVVVVAAGTAAGELIASRTFVAEHRHGSHLLPTIEALTHDEGLPLDRCGGVIVGLGPGAFTGLRVGLATAKTLAHALELPIVGVSTGEALLATAGHEHGRAATLVLPAGPHDRVVVVSGEAPRLEAGDATAEPDGAIAVDLEGRASSAALEVGRRALAALPATLLRLGAERLRSGESDDVERLVPAYVSLPRGITTDMGDGGVAWSRDPR